ncbi:MAG: hypothetical protein FWE40_03625 [Oscillospiraceae bacterium]|nr:hypothetical protein [Oscillospiraceae bacterium]
MKKLLSIAFVGVFLIFSLAVVSSARPPRTPEDFPGQWYAIDCACAHDCRCTDRCDCNDPIPWYYRWTIHPVVMIGLSVMILVIVVLLIRAIV